MIDRKKLVEGLEYCIEANGKNCPMACPFFDKCFSCFESSEPFYPIMHAALEFLKEQEAKPAVVTTNAYGTKFYHCPKCNRDLYAYPRQRYCSQCGQAVKWE